MYQCISVYTYVSMTLSNPIYPSTSETLSLSLSLFVFYSILYYSLEYRNAPHRNLILFIFLFIPIAYENLYKYSPFFPSFSHHSYSIHRECPLWNVLFTWQPVARLRQRARANELAEPRLRRTSDEETRYRVTGRDAMCGWVEQIATANGNG